MQGEIVDRSNCYTHLQAFFFISAALIPDPVENLKIDVDQDAPSVTLDWEPPQNVGARPWSDVSSYWIRFKPQGKKYYEEMNVDSFTTSVVLKRDSGLIPHTRSIFEVRAQCGDDLGKWKQVSAFIRECTLMYFENGRPRHFCMWPSPSRLLALLITRKCRTLWGRA